ncbi:MAG TPA: UDP-4-amino-4,6-dideoxy-N-acetyl-beta-L-altrosamine transaminase [Candidatus Sulfotelmatobacter sp.]|nr:UDP-4-amino-4,6-dideoxy-N-acetyl-beta-L-altrosamine transaminase [Candidatus Sulfotelmatobacter sp.]
MLTRTAKLALDGGIPVRSTPLPYGKQWIDDADIAAVVDVLRSDWLTTGPKVEEFEATFAAATGARYAVSFSSGTAALHGAVAVLDLNPGDEAITTPLTFCASANCLLYCGVRPAFADVDSDTLLIDPAEIARKITPRTKALVVVDYAGQPAALRQITELAEKHGLAVIEDACHALGATFEGQRVGAISTMTAFSFHPVKHVTTAEGGMITTNDPALAGKLRRFRSHGIGSDHRQREKVGSWFYEMVDLGYNYRLSDLQCALGLSQLAKLDRWLSRRRAIAAAYDTAFSQLPAIRPLSVIPGVEHAYHLYVVQLELNRLRASRAQVFAALRAEGIGVNVHYIPVHLHPYYREHQGTAPGLCPRAEAAYERILSLPMFPLMSDQDVNDVIEAVHKVVAEYSK